MPFPTIDPSVNEYTNPITEATYMRGPNDVWIQADQFNTVDISVLKDAFDAEYVNIVGDTMTGALNLSHVGDGNNSLQLRGRRPGSADSVTDDLVFWLHHNAGTVGDAINYKGRIESEDNIVNKKYVDDAVSGAGSITGFVKKDGDTMTGTLFFDGENSRIAAGTATNLTGRCTLLLTTTGSLPVGISSGSGTSKILSLYRYDNSKDDNRDEIATFQANGYTRLGGKLRISPGLLGDAEVAFEVKDDSNPRAQIRKSGKLELKPSDTSGYVFTVNPAGLDSGNSKSAFKVWTDGTVQAGSSASEAFMASSDHDVATKKYVDSQSGSVPVVSSTPSGVAKGDVWYNTSDNCLHIKIS